MAAAVALFAVSCTKETVPEDKIELVKSSYVFTSEGGSAVLSFTSSAAWSIKSDKGWVTFTQKQGEAGEASVTFTVAASEEYEDRDASISLTCGQKTAQVSVKQLAKAVFGSSVVLSVDSREQNIALVVVTNVDYEVNVDEKAKSWIEQVEVKSAPAEESVVMHIAANTGLMPREGSFSIVSGGNAQVYTVKQSSDFDVMNTAYAYYLGNRHFVWDAKDQSYTSLNQFAVELSDGLGSSVTILLNAASDAAKDVLPTGEFTVDAAGTYDAGTISLKATSGYQLYYTTIKEGDSEILAYDAVVNIERDEEGIYTITALVSDRADVVRSYAYIGAIEVEDQHFGAQADQPFCQGQYYTYFAGGAQEWHVNLYVSNSDDTETPTFRYIQMKIFGNPGDSQEVPCGEFTFEEAEYDNEISYASGTLKATPHTFYVEGNDYNDDGVFVALDETDLPELTISKNDDGTYNFTLKGTFSQSAGYDENYEPIYNKFQYDETFEKVYLSEPSYGPVPVLDVDTEFNSVMFSNLIALWFGTPIDANNLFVGWFNYVNDAFTVYLAINTDENYTFEKNLKGMYCSTPVPDGTYTFSKTGGSMTLLPVLYGTQSYCYILNTYTGSKFVIDGGSVTVSGGTITYDVTATGETPEGTKTLKFTGSHAYSYYYARDYSARASYISLKTDE